MRVALIQAPVWWTVDPPLGLAQVAGAAKAAGHEVIVSDLNMRMWRARPKAYDSLWVWEQFHFWNRPEFVSRVFAEMDKVVSQELERILRSDAPVIGLSVQAGAQLATLEVARRLKQADPKRKIVLGGQYFFFGDKIAETLAEPAVDAIVRGAADESFPELLKRFAASGEIEPAPGVWVWRAGRAVSGGEPVPVSDLDKTAFPDLSGFPLELYTDPVRIPIAASRGCVWQCRFCSARAFWKGYTYMSGERIFAEVLHQKRLYPERCHFEFYDITANGDPRQLHRFARLMSDAMLEDSRNFIGWKINAIIRPEMTPELLKDMRRSNGHDIIYGIESGSARVLKSMNKPYDIAVAERVLKDTHDAGITTTVNIMFGFPGESEEDFQETLSFVRRNRHSLDRVYGSATFTSLEEKSYLADHAPEFGIKSMDGERAHNLYWESVDGTNTYPVRLERYQRFRALAGELGLDAYKGINGALEQDRLSNLAQYWHFVGQPLEAIRNYLDYLQLDLYHEPTLRHLEVQAPKLKAFARAARWAEKGREERARAILEALAGERWRLEREESGLAVFWSAQRLPSSQQLKELSRRVEMVLALVSGEKARGEDKRPEPVCAR